MVKELTWVCALLPGELNRQLVELCREENKFIGLPEDVFRFEEILHKLHDGGFTKAEAYTTPADSFVNVQVRALLEGEKAALMKNIMEDVFSSQLPSL
jgi:hypothetical protein